MTDTTSRGHLTRALTTLALAILFMLSACSGAQPVGEDKMDLKDSVQTFHKNLRWSRYEVASLQLTPSYRQSFLGRYEEMGDDMHFVQLEVLQITREDEGLESKATVEVLQKWYKEPDMTVKTDKIMELWSREKGGWMLTERIEKSEWRERERAKKKAALESEETPAEPSPAE